MAGEENPRRKGMGVLAEAVLFVEYLGILHHMSPINLDMESC